MRPVTPAPEQPKPKPGPAPARSAPQATAVRSAAEQRAAKDSIRAAMLAVLDPAPAVELSQLDSSPAGNVARVRRYVANRLVGRRAG